MFQVKTLALALIGAQGLVGRSVTRSLLNISRQRRAVYAANTQSILGADAWYVQIYEQ